MSALGHFGANVVARGPISMGQARMDQPPPLPQKRSSLLQWFDYIERFHNPRMKRRLGKRGHEMRRVCRSENCFTDSESFNYGPAISVVRYELRRRVSTSVSEPYIHVFRFAGPQNILLPVCIVVAGCCNVIVA